MFFFPASTRNIYVLNRLVVTKLFLDFRCVLFQLLIFFLNLQIHSMKLLQSTKFNCFQPHNYFLHHLFFPLKKPNIQIFELDYIVLSFLNQKLNFTASYSEFSAAHARTVQKIPHRAPLGGPRSTPCEFFCTVQHGAKIFARCGTVRKFSHRA